MKTQFDFTATRWAIAAAAMAAVLLARPGAAADAEYRLGVQDRVRVRVVEWQPVEGAFREWDAVSGEYTVGAGGTISVPFAGETIASGKTASEVARAISEKLQQQFGLSSRPETSLEIAAYRPIYVSGDVGTPGEYAYSPGLNVAKALSLAGGVRGDRLRTERDFISAKGNYDALEDERLRLLVRQVRLGAEAARESEFVLSEALKANPLAESVAASEASIMNARQRKLELQLKALADLQDLLEKEIVSLERKLVTQQRQMELARKELQGVGTLAEKGLVSSTRVFNAERTIADIEGKNLDLETFILRARQDISKAQQDMINLTNSMASDIAVERQKVEADLASVTVRLGMYRGLMTEALQTGSIAVSGGLAALTTYSLVREVDGKPVEIGATETTQVQPGDLVRATTVLTGSGPAGMTAPGQ